MAGSSAASLFDDFERTCTSPATYSEATFEYLNRAAGERWGTARAVCEAWFADYPAESRAELRGRFRSCDEGQHGGAWWELYVYTLYKRLGYEVEVHPPVPGKGTNPDFLVALGPHEMYVECTVIFATDGPITATPAIEAWIYDCIDSTTNRNFLVGLKIEQAGNITPSAKDVARPLDDWLATLDPEAVPADVEATNTEGELGAYPEKTFHVRDWILTYTAIPNPPDGRYPGGRLLGSLPSKEASWSRDADKIFDAVKSKGGHYGSIDTLDKPLIVAVLSVGAFTEEEDVSDALFGRRAVEFIPGDRESIRWVRQRDGYWRPNSERGGRVSGVLFSHDMRPWSVASHLPSAWINPWARNPISGHPPLTTFTADAQGLGPITADRSLQVPADVLALRPK
jgi:hypothetical protein